jgi:hypothetical protein
MMHDKPATAGEVALALTIFAVIGVILFFIAWWLVIVDVGVLLLLATAYS